MNAMIRNFLVEEDGVTAVEYGILAAIVATVIGGTFSSSLGTLFTQIFNAIGAAVTKAAG